MSKRVEAAITRAGTLDRAKTHITVAQQATGNAYRELLKEEPEVAAIIARVMMDYSGVLMRLANL
jgi:hypothetical protein